jgi:hypothetical protein
MTNNNKVARKARGTTIMYEVNANGNKSYRNASAKKVAEVAVAWKKNGFEPKAYALADVGGTITVNEAAVTTIAATTKALVSAR